jgi:hypothetical protein
MSDSESSDYNSSDELFTMIKKSAKEKEERKKNLPNKQLWKENIAEETPLKDQIIGHQNGVELT